MASDNSKIILNGPLNYIELYNSNTKQTICLFMDLHENITKQKKCEEYEAKDIDKYLYKILSETNKTLDFFLEINPTDILKDKKIHTNDKYILEIRKMFRKMYKEQEINKSQNVRLHYMDVRDFSFFNEIIHFSMNQLLNEVYQYELSNINYLIDELNYIMNKLLYIKSSITEIKNNDDNNSLETIHDYLKKIDMISLNLSSYKNKSNENKSNENTNLNNNDNSNNNKNEQETENLTIEQKFKIGFIQLLLKILTKYTDINNKNNIINFFNNFITGSDEAIIIIKNLIQNLEEFNKLFDYQNQNSELVIEKIIINKEKNLIYNTPYYGMNYTQYRKLSRNVYDELLKLDTLLLRLGSIFMDCFF